MKEHKKKNTPIRSLLVRGMPALVLVGFISGMFLVLFATPAWAATQSIDGDPIDVNVFDAGRIESYYYNWVRVPVL